MKTKSTIKVCIISLILGCVTLVAAYSFPFFLKNKTNVEEVNAAAMSIGSYNDLVSFKDKVNSDGEYDLYATLTSDIDCGGRELTPIGWGDEPYEGVFDGAGFTISNFKINYAVSAEYGIESAQGFFGSTNGATVKNVKLKDVTFGVGMSGNSCSVGALIGCAINTDVEVCAVENFLVNASGYERFYAGGIVGLAEDGGSIKFCYVENFDISGVCNRRINTAPIFAVAGICSYGASVSLSVVAPANCSWSVKYTLGDGSESTKILDPGNKSNITSNDAEHLRFEYCAIEGATNCVSSSHSQATAVISNYMSSSGGKDANMGSKENVHWYRNTSYHSFPQLRLFIDWTEYVVNSSDQSIATIIGSSPVSIPSSVEINPDLNSSSLSIGGLTFSVSMKNSDYVFDKWTRSGNVFTAKFKGKAATLKFNAVNNATLNNNNTAVEYKIGLSSTVHVTINENNNGETYTLTFSFTEYGKTGTTSVTYTTAEGYYVKNQGLSKTSSFTAGEVIQVTPVISAKKFGIEFI